MEKQPTRVLFVGNIPYELGDEQVLGMVSARACQVKI